MSIWLKHWLMIKVCESLECTGCGACENVCPKDALVIKADKYGYIRPFIDPSKCIDCHLCNKACPNNQELSFNTPIHAFVAAAVDRTEQWSSTSGGVASALARVVIREGGVVYGSTGFPANNVHHIRVEREDDLALLKGSKYVQSSMGGGLRTLKQDIMKGRRVLFIGTPCQCAGVRSFLRKDYSNLCLVDFVCHGVPNQQILSSALHTYAPGVNLSESSVVFREKDSKGESHYCLKLYAADKDIVFNGDYPKNEYIVGFLHGLFYRDSCYQCHYSRPERVSDITVGDYLDREKKYIDFPWHSGGLSMVLVNTEVGESFLSKATESVAVKEGLLNEFVTNNGQLSHPIPRHPMTDYFRSHYVGSWVSVAKYCLKKDYKAMRRNNLIVYIRDIIYRIPGMKSLYRKLNRK